MPTAHAASSRHRSPTRLGAPSSPSAAGVSPPAGGGDSRRRDRVVAGVAAGRDAEVAVSYAAREAAARGTSLELVHVLRPGTPRPAGGLEEAEVGALHRARQVAAAEAPLVPVTSTLLGGPPAESLVAHAESAGAAGGRRLGDGPHRPVATGVAVDGGRGRSRVPGGGGAAGCGAHGDPPGGGRAQVAAPRGRGAAGGGLRRGRAVALRPRGGARRSRAGVPPRPTDPAGTRPGLGARADGTRRGAPGRAPSEAPGGPRARRRGAVVPCRGTDGQRRAGHRAHGVAHLGRASPARSSVPPRAASCTWRGAPWSWCPSAACTVPADPGGKDPASGLVG